MEVEVDGNMLMEMEKIYVKTEKGISSEEEECMGIEDEDVRYGKEAEEEEDGIVIKEEDGIVIKEEVSLEGVL